MQIIVITLPTFIEKESNIIEKLFSLGVDRIHIRKPNASISKCRELIKEIPSYYHSKLSLHDNFELTDDFNIGGLHLNQRNPFIPKSFKGIVSRSCHSLKEIIKYKALVNYLFLSPIFDSISKKGYMSAFTHENLVLACKQKIIDDKVYALGGISLKNIKQLPYYGFGGAVLLGDVWEKVDTKSFESYIKQLITNSI